MSHLLFSMKNPPQCGLSSKLFDHLLLFLFIVQSQYTIAENAMLSQGILNYSILEIRYNINFLKKYITNTEQYNNIN